MAFRTAAVTVTTTPTRLDVYEDADSRIDSSLYVFNEGAADIRVGGPDVAMSGATRGVKVAAGEDISVDLNTASGKGDPHAYAVCASGTVDVTVAQMGV